MRVVLRAFASLATLGAAIAEQDFGDVEIDVGVSLLQVQANKHYKASEVEGELEEDLEEEERPRSSTPRRSNLCRSGLRSGRFCCGGNCGKCGGRGCQNRPGGGDACCTNEITRNNRRCVGANMQNCLLPPPGNGRGKMGGSRGKMGGKMGGGNDNEPEPVPTDIAVPEIVEELALCEETLDLTNVVHSNLGAAGPDGGSADLIFGEVLDGVNLVITASSSYTPNMLNPSGGVLRNGARDGFGVINLASGSSVDLKFSFVDATTGAPAPKSFVMTFFDADHGMAHESREAFTINGFTSYVVDPATTLTVTPINIDAYSLVDGAGSASFTSSLRGSKEDNPLSPLSLSPLQKERSVTAYFENKAEFTVSLSETGYVNPQGRNHFFAGASNLICQGEAKCSSFNCPEGFALNQNAEFVLCLGRPCPASDMSKCCHRQATTAPPTDYYSPNGMGGWR